jgi:MFS family permease
MAAPALQPAFVRMGYAEEQRGFANALIDAGTKIGPALSTLLGGLVVAHYGWRALFLFVGIGSLLWLIPWLWLVPSEKRAAKESGVATPPRESGVAWPVLLMRREVWVTSLGMFCLGYAWYFLVSWLPAYLVEERGFSKEDMAVFGSLPFWAMAVTSLLGGWCSDRWIRGGGTPTRVRKTFLITGFLLCALFMVVAVRATEAGRCVAFLTAACAALGFYSSNVWAVTQTLAGTAAAGRWTGLQNCVGNLGGVVSPIVTGMIVTRTGSFTLAFTASAAMLLLGAVLYAVLLGRIVRSSGRAAPGKLPDTCTKSLSFTPSPNSSASRASIPPTRAVSPRRAWSPGCASSAGAAASRPGKPRSFRVVRISSPDFPAVIRSAASSSRPTPTPSRSRA